MGCSLTKALFGSPPLPYCSSRSGGRASTIARSSSNPAPRAERSWESRSFRTGSNFCTKLVTCHCFLHKFGHGVIIPESQHSSILRKFVKFNVLVSWLRTKFSWVITSKHEMSKSNYFCLLDSFERAYETMVIYVACLCYQLLWSIFHTYIHIMLGHVLFVRKETSSIL